MIVLDSLCFKYYTVCGKMIVSPPSKVFYPVLFHKRKINKITEEKSVILEMVSEKYYYRITSNKPPGGLFFQRGRGVGAYSRGALIRGGRLLIRRPNFENSSVQIPNILANADGTKVWDTYACHLSEDIKSNLRKKRVDTEYVLGGCTAYIQTADVSRNKPFKAA